MAHILSVLIQYVYALYFHLYERCLNFYTTHPYVYDVFWFKEKGV